MSLSVPPRLRHSQRYIHSLDIVLKLTAFLRIPVVADQHLLALRPEQRRPVDGVVEAQPAVVEDVDVAGADLVQRLELQGGDPTLLQDQQRYTAAAAGEGGGDLHEGREERRIFKKFEGHQKRRADMWKEETKRPKGEVRSKAIRSRPLVTTDL